MNAARDDSRPPDEVEELMATSRVLTAVVARSLARAQTSVTTPQLRVLVMLSVRGPVNLTAVAEGLGVNPSNASRTCERLVAAELVHREEDPDDRRHIALRLSPTGERLVESLMSDRRRLFTQIVEQMRPVDRRHLHRGLEGFLQATRQVSDAADLVDGEGTVMRWLG